MSIFVGRNQELSMLEMEQQIHFCISPDGARIAYATSGTGPPLVRVANWLTHLDLDWKSPVWYHWFEELSRGHTLVRYDPRGCGLSDRSVDDLSLDAWVGDLAAVVDALELDRFSLLGFCQGGATAVAYAVRHPERVSRLVLYDSYVQGALVEGADPCQAREADALAEMIEIGWGQEAAAFRQVFTNLLIPGASMEQQRWFAELQRQTVSPATAVRLWRAFHNIDIQVLAERIRLPTLVFHVEGDAIVPFNQGMWLASLIPDARFVPLPGKNHILLEDEPAWSRFLAELRSFLRTAVPEPEPSDARYVFPELTPREREVLELIAQGLSNDEISERLVIAPKTVRNHVSRIYSKLRLGSRAQVVVLARQAGLGRQDPGLNSEHTSEGQT
jgi:pimeloyl-ACP methyl ester carboxylesterase/DNA-binding CsgD family transcriptional regulator